MHQDISRAVCAHATWFCDVTLIHLIYPFSSPGGFSTFLSSSPCIFVLLHNRQRELTSCCLGTKAGSTWSVRSLTMALEGKLSSRALLTKPREYGQRRVSVSRPEPTQATTLACQNSPMLLLGSSERRPTCRQPPRSISSRYGSPHSIAMLIRARYVDDVIACRSCRSL